MHRVLEHGAGVAKEYSHGIWSGLVQQQAGAALYDH